MSLELPLKGVRVLDLSRVLAGPYCTLTLADMGADVIKIENPEGGDEARAFAPMHPADKAQSIYFLNINRNKRSVALDLKDAGAKAAFLKLVEKADVVVENYRTGVMERLGLGYETLKAQRPSLVYCAISGYGRSGPNVEVPGYDPIAQAESGFMSLIGEPEHPPVRTGPSVVDMVTGLFSSQAITAALRHAALTGEGRFIEATLHETALNMLLNFGAMNLMSGANPTRSGNTNQVVQPAALFEAADGPFVLAITNDRQFQSLAREILGRPELAEDPRYKANGARVQNGAALREILATAFKAKPRAELIERLREAGIATGAVATVAEALNTELVTARGAIGTFNHPTLGSYRAVKAPARLHDTTTRSPDGAPLLGQHTREVLREVAELDDEQISALERRRAIKSA